MLFVIDGSIHGLYFETSCSTDCTYGSCPDPTSISTQVIPLSHIVVHAAIFYSLNCLSEVLGILIGVILFFWSDLNIGIGGVTPRLLCSTLDPKLV